MRCPWPLALALLLVAALAASARLDPALPFLFSSGRLDWWVHPEPLFRSGETGAQRLVFRFRPRAPGRLEVAAMRRFRLFEDGRLRGGRMAFTLGTPLGAAADRGSWKTEVLRVDVGGGELAVEVEDDRWLPAVGLGGPAAPEGVSVARDGRAVAAVRAGRVSLPRLGAAAAPLLLALPALGLLVLAALLTRRARVDGAPPRPAGAAASLPGTPAPRVVAAALLLHALLAAWNVARYPLERGLDAAGHVAYAQLIREERALPDPGRGWQTYHPPLYHALGALLVAATGTPWALQLLSTLAGAALVAVAARALGPERWRGTLLVALLPVLLVSAPQATNELLFAALATGALVAGSGDAATPRRLLAAGALAGLALLTKYTGVLVLAALAIAAATAPPAAAPADGRAAEAASAPPGRLRRLALLVLPALLVGSWPYLERLRLHGDPLAGNWDDGLGHPYRQPPGYRTAAWFLRFGGSLLAHPFAAREASLWDSLYASTVGDGFGRFVTTRPQHLALVALAWLALPLLAATLAGFAVLAWRPERASGLERAGLAAALLVVAGLVRFNLELPYYSAAKGVFALALALPGALAFERGRALLAARLGRPGALLLDAATLAFAALSAAVFAYR